MHYRTCLYLFLLITLTSCVAVENNVPKDVERSLSFKQLRDSALLPKWFFTPSPGNQVGSLGMARTVSVGGNPEYHARKYALNGLLDYYEITADEENQNYKDLITGEKDSAVIGGKNFSIPDVLVSSDYVVARAIEGDSKISQADDVKGFSPYECSPGWICSPASGDYGGVLGVSYRAVSPQRQYELAIKNGLLLLKYSYGVDVKGTEEVRRLRSGTGVIRLRKNNLSLKVLGNKDSIKLYVKEVRFVGETIYLWLVSPDLPSFDSNNSWIYGDVAFGATGSSGKTASNLLSAQIEAAVENAVINMAKNKELGVEVYEFMEKTSNCSLFDQLIKSSVNTKVFPGLRGFYLDRSERVKVWMVPN